MKKLCPADDSATSSLFLITRFDAAWSAADSCLRCIQAVHQSGRAIKIFFIGSAVLHLAERSSAVPHPLIGLKEQVEREGFDKSQSIDYRFCRTSWLRWMGTSAPFPSLEQAALCSMSEIFLECVQNDRVYRF